MIIFIILSIFFSITCYTNEIDEEITALEKRVTLNHCNNLILEFTLDNNVALKNREKVIMDTPAKTINGRTMLPLRINVIKLSEYKVDEVSIKYENDVYFII